ncbi:M48 family metallopeptidase [Pseudochryseolinea flava]|uniref:M48 family peptidase n=1 Tax=Pseudochryseolinea flava TaxID=2059302 RepID=A0A364Y642_9BACT|nr:M48 family metallopeptidase [Pseudochryseolinea flava]RAW01705.1 M48 family peptidase [Pseudochryseolinea flava]
MQPQQILYTILAITVIGYIFDQLLDYINLRAQPNDIPDDVAIFYDRQKYQTSIGYHREKTKFGFLTAGVSFLISIGMLWWGGYGWLDAFLRPYIQHQIFHALAFFGIIAIISDVIMIPFQLYNVFVIEEKYGFNKSTVKLFFLDKLKGYLLGGIIGGLLLSSMIYLVVNIGDTFWIWFAVVACTFVFLMNMFYASLIVPMFNKLTPLPDGELKEAIEAFAKKVAFPLDNIFVIDGSKRSSKSNAYFSGIGRKKKIVLYDTLINNHTTEELVAVLAHEVGHFRKKHIVWTFLLSIIQIVFTLFILSLMIFNQDVSLALGGEQLSIPLNLIAFAVLFSPISGITSLLMNIFSRKNEYEADAYAKENYAAAPLVHALKKLSVDNLSDLYPHPLYVFFHYSHPPLLKRLQAMEA